MLSAVRFGMQPPPPGYFDQRAGQWRKEGFPSQAEAKKFYQWAEAEVVKRLQRNPFDPATSEEKPYQYQPEKTVYENAVAKNPDKPWLK